MSKCSYCNSAGDRTLFLLCSLCDRKVHIECLKSGCVPGGLLGDNFFRFICRSCSEDNSEQMFRQKMSWFSVITLALYNLQRRSEGVSRRGFYHWKIHICNFIDRHWNILFDPSVKRKKSWMGTVSGTLSHFCPTFFVSGTEVLREPGWWRLYHVNTTPEDIINAHVEAQIAKKKGSGAGNTSQHTSSLLSSQSCTSQNASQLNSEVEEFAMNLFHQKGEMASTSYSFDVCSFSNSNVGGLIVKEEDYTSDMAIDVDDESVDFVGGYGDGFQDFGSLLPPVSSYSAESSCSSILSILPDITNHTEDHLPQFSLEDSHLNSVFFNEEKIIKIENIKEEAPDPVSDEGGSVTTDDCPVLEKAIPLEQTVPKSLFKITPEELRVPPWKELEKKEREYWIRATQSRLVPMTEYEELQLLSQLRQAAKHEELPDYARRLYRKLCVRQQKRQLGLPLFDLDRVFLPNGKIADPRSVWVKTDKKVSSTDAPILDRFYHVPLKSDDNYEGKKCSFKIRLMGQCEPACFHSPYTQRVLKPFIRRDYETNPLWLKLLREVQEKANKNKPNWSVPPRSPIDYCYVRPHHISTVNSLCCEFFYPGVDLSEALQYPDFSCVVLYKKLIVAFAFMVPDVGINETYITFFFTRPEWRNAGIGTFMLYHLIQTCMGKDITLHVSATNPAVLLYQKFGFKIEEFILDFYDKYLPADSNQCKHALFLRLSR